MRFATFIAQQYEHFGLVLTHPLSGEDWVFEPGLTQQRLLEYASRGTSPYVATRPLFWEDGAPTDMTAFLALGAEGMQRMRRMQDFLLRFLEQADTFMLLGAGQRLADVKLRAPVPRPRLIFGLVQNSPTVWRHVPERQHLNVFPQGHQRPLGCVIDPGDPIYLPYAETISGGWNPELGVIIGRGGRDIPVSQAMQHVAGLTIVSDVTVDYFRCDYFQQPEPRDWFEDAMSSWGDKKSDARFPIGPYLVTLDEVGNPYDLLIYTRQAGHLRDRSHTGAMHVGIERTIAWLSSFRALHPGDILHMGTMGYDGSPFLTEPLEGDVLESEIERLGVLRNPVHYASAPDHENARDEKRIYAAPALRELRDTPGEIIASPTDWSPGQARHLWTLFGNDQSAEARGGFVPRPYPRFLAAPNTALASSGARVLIPARACDLMIGCELGCVVGRIASQLSVEEAEAAILGYLPLGVVRDSSFADAVVEPASMQERHLPAVYARWADGFNIAGAPLALAGEAWRGRRCTIHVEGYEAVQASSDAYLFSAAQVLAYITRYITLFPGDVIVLGPLNQGIFIAQQERPATLTGWAEIEGLGRAAFTLAAQL